MEPPVEQLWFAARRIARGQSTRPPSQVLSSFEAAGLVPGAMIFLPLNSSTPHRAEYDGISRISQQWIRQSVGKQGCSY